MPAGPCFLRAEVAGPKIKNQIFGKIDSPKAPPIDKQVSEVRRRRICTLATMSASPSLSAPMGVLNSVVMKQITDLCAAFAARYNLQPPEFSHPRHWYGAKDIYDDYSAGLRGSSWFQALITSAHHLDLEGLGSLAVAPPHGDGYQFCMIRCLQFALLEAALRRDRAYKDVSPAIPAWFRAAGWDIPADWHCEIRAANETFLARQDAALAAAARSDLHPCRSCSTYFRLSESADGDHCSAVCSTNCPPYSAVPPGLEQPRPATNAEWMAFNGTRAPSPPASPLLSAAAGSV
jgi:hypothetical protein